MNDDIDEGGIVFPVSFPALESARSLLVSCSAGSETHRSEGSSIASVLGGALHFLRLCYLMQDGRGAGDETRQLCRVSRALVLPSVLWPRGTRRLCPGTLDLSPGMGRVRRRLRERAARVEEIWRVDGVEGQLTASGKRRTSVAAIMSCVWDVDGKVGFDGWCAVVLQLGLLADAAGRVAPTARRQKLFTVRSPPANQPAQAVFCLERQHHHHHRAWYLPAVPDTVHTSCAIRTSSHSSLVPILPLSLLPPPVAAHLRPGFVVRLL
ncbi:hypothetical protein TPAR_01056 [Tolypocladium paradoxum]|uniref:Uncharacterized protein n=1 Tax=Tolypocladium paradoxum TaxID=94208 RepID=A0A2S4L8G4_9HYPO|nr:hypothetical protein TPAR_01056 [Tolypocladium paradoxum]